HNTIRSNMIYANGSTGLYLYGTANFTVVSNQIFYSKSQFGMWGPGGTSGCLFVNNNIYANKQYRGTRFDNSSSFPTVFISNYLYGNDTEAIGNPAGNALYIRGALGYDANGNSRPNGSTELTYAGGNTSYEFRSIRVNPARPLITTGFPGAGQSAAFY